MNVVPAFPLTRIAVQIGPESIVKLLHGFLTIQVPVAVADGPDRTHEVQDICQVRLPVADHWYDGYTGRVRQETDSFARHDAPMTEPDG